MIGVDHIVEAVAAYHGRSAGDLMTDRRSRDLARGRQMAMALAHELTHLSLAAIGKAFDRDQTAVLDACKNIEVLRRDRPFVDDEWRELMGELMESA